MASYQSTSSGLQTPTTDATQGAGTKSVPKDVVATNIPDVGDEIVKVPNPAGGKHKAPPVAPITKKTKRVVSRQKPSAKPSADLSENLPLATPTISTPQSTPLSVTPSSAQPAAQFAAHPVSLGSNIVAYFRSEDLYAAYKDDSGRVVERELSVSAVDMDFDKDIFADVDDTPPSEEKSLQADPLSGDTHASLESILPDFDLPVSPVKMKKDDMLAWTAEFTNRFAQVTALLGQSPKNLMLDAESHSDVVAKLNSLLEHPYKSFLFVEQKSQAESFLQLLGKCDAFLQARETRESFVQTVSAMRKAQTEVKQIAVDSTVAAQQVKSLNQEAKSLAAQIKTLEEKLAGVETSKRQIMEATNKAHAVAKEKNLEVKNFEAIYPAEKAKYDAAGHRLVLVNIAWDHFCAVLKN